MSAECMNELLAYSCEHMDEFYFKESNLQIKGYMSLIRRADKYGGNDLPYGILTLYAFSGTLDLIFIEESRKAALLGAVKIKKDKGVESDEGKFLCRRGSGGKI